MSIHNQRIQEYDRWDGFRWDNAILSVRDLVDGPDSTIAAERLREIEPSDLARWDVQKGDWWVFALNRHDVDLYLVHRMSGEVLWWAGEVVDRFESITYFLHVNASFLEEDIQRLQTRALP